jgi:uncharacterized membrane protein
MTGSLSALAAAVVLFIASHLVLSMPTLRQALVARLGERSFRALYSLLAIVLIVWVAMAYRDAPVEDVWLPPIGLMHLSLAIMPFACLLVVAGMSTPNPSALGGDTPEVPGREPGGILPVGILKVTRHPVMWGIALWGIAHLLANGDAASLMLFGGMTFLALAGAGAQETKKRVQLGRRWDGFVAQTSYLPFAAMAAGRTRLRLVEIGWWRIAAALALYALLLVLHTWLFGASPLPL